MVEKTLHERALDHFGADAQLIALVEELSEAAAAALRVVNGKGTISALVAELCDVGSVSKSLAPVLGTPESPTWVHFRKIGETKLAKKLPPADLAIRARIFVSCPSGHTWAIEPNADGKCVVGPCPACPPELAASGASPIGFQELGS